MKEILIAPDAEGKLHSCMEGALSQAGTLFYFKGDHMPQEWLKDFGYCKDPEELGAVERGRRLCFEVGNEITPNILDSFSEFIKRRGIRLIFDNKAWHLQPDKYKAFWKLSYAQCSVTIVLQDEQGLLGERMTETEKLDIRNKWNIRYMKKGKRSCQDYFTQREIEIIRWLGDATNTPERLAEWSQSGEIYPHEINDDLRKALWNREAWDVISGVGRKNYAKGFMAAARRLERKGKEGHETSLLSTLP